MFTTYKVPNLTNQTKRETMNDDLARFLFSHPTERSFACGVSRLDETSPLDIHGLDVEVSQGSFSRFVSVLFE